jgi:hypothetical protein
VPVFLGYSGVTQKLKDLEYIFGFKNCKRLKEEAELIPRF